MTTARRITGLGIALCFPASLLVGQAAFAQEATAPAATPAATQPAPAEAAPRTVTINGKRKKAESMEVFTAKSKMFSRNSAASHAFMRSYSAEYDDVVVEYAKHFGLYDENPSYNSLKEAEPILLATWPGDDNARPYHSNSDRKFAFGQRHIMRNDTTLGDALDAVDRKDYATALGLFKVAYNKVGYDKAALMIGKLHLNGFGTPQDTRQAVEWLIRVTDARYDPARDRFKFDEKQPEAMNERIDAAMTLAKIYLFGIGTAKNQVEARKWYGKAADYGFIPASNTLGLAYLSGFGGAKNPAKAIAYLKEAAEVGFAPAQYELGKLYLRGTDTVTQDDNLARVYLGSAAKNGHPRALLTVARMYDTGEAIGADQNKAIAYYKDAATKGDADAQTAFATYFYTGEIVKQDLVVARKLLDAAARQGHPEAMFNLGVMSTRGEGGPKDMAVAYAWLTLAKSAGFDKAGAAMQAVAPMLSPDERLKADALLRPQS